MEKRALFRETFKRTVPILCSYLFIGAAYGMLMAEAGQRWYVSLLVSLLVYTGAFQFVLISFLAAATPHLSGGFPPHGARYALHDAHHD